MPVALTYAASRTLEKWEKEIQNCVSREQILLIKAKFSGDNNELMKLKQDIKSTDEKILHSLNLILEEHRSILLHYCENRLIQLQNQEV